MQAVVTAEQGDRRAELEAFALMGLVRYPDLLAESGLTGAHFADASLRKLLAALPAVPYRKPEGGVALAHLAHQAGVPLGDLADYARHQVFGVDQARAMLRRLRSLVAADRMRSELARLSTSDLGDEPDVELVAKLEALARAEALHVVAGETRTLRQAAERAITDAEAELAGERRGALRSSLEVVTRKTKGYRAGELTLLVAEGGAGKSTFAMQEMRNAAKAGAHSLLVSGEMTEAQIGEREMHALAGLFLSHDMRPMDLHSAREQLASVEYPDRIHLDTRYRTTAAEVLAVARRLMSQHPLGLLVYDHAAHLDVGKADGDYDQYRKATAAAKEIAKALPMPVLMLTHLNRKRSEKTAPTRDMLRGAGEDLADVILCIWRHVTEGRDCTEMHFLKSRQTGARGHVALGYDAYSQRYEELPEGGR